MAVRAADFRPHPLLRNRHLQSILASSGVRRLLRRPAAVAAIPGAVEQILDCGGGVRLQGYYNAQQARAASRGLVVLLHGWEGSTDSSYVVATGLRLLREGFDIFRLNFRDHGDTHHLNPGLFHSCLIDEAVGAVRAVAGHYPQQPLAVVGFSLGGNFALRIALRAPAAGIALAYVLAVCPVIDPQAGLFGLETGPRLYERYFMHKWRESLRRKQAAFPDTALFGEGELRCGLRDLTRLLVLRHTPFASLEDYLAGYSVAGPTLAGLALPATILTAADDPVIPIADFYGLVLPPHAELDIARYGGHCAFIGDFSLRSWTEDYIAERLDRHLGPARAG
ncbi:YheT family hydrolase [Dokdonella koreensis]|uniref:Hydrolase of the alpha/beta-hydrolase fold protein n=1 Tax=Dokdonella koreensis DS-123 TaxID=1300342 RepID=A0A167G2A8_9GAMM|nr:alpha/beta fold hydrolase [Dokdonella koreensis]ANB16078.1 Putative hydrolase of the alpha/beta-hydrolase fold protein [Dokdonella koreensis DS-123]